MKLPVATRGVFSVIGELNSVSRGKSPATSHESIHKKIDSIKTIFSW